MTDKSQLWEYLKCQLRTDTILYSCNKAKYNKKVERELEQKLNIIEEKLNSNIHLSEVEYLEYIRTKSDWESHINRRNNGIILRSKAKWVEEGEKNTKYFLNLEKRNYNNTCIKTLINKNNKEVSDMEDIILEQKNFYESLYTSKIQNEMSKTEIINTFTLDQNLPKLSEIDKQMCDNPITIEECSKALKLLPNNKSPGSDGFTTNFYKFFWKDLKDLLFESYQSSFETKQLTTFQRMGILNLLPKKDKDLRYLANWRPVSLLNTDYKILTKLLALRLQKVIPVIINSDQVGYIKKRYIGENVRIISDILQYADLENIEAYITQIDFEKAFDSIEWEFLFETLKTFNFGETFISWIKTIYTDISACVGNNGHYSKYFELSRSIRQGCPISALLFLLVVELLANKIRGDEDIKGIEIGNTIYKISMMADDTTLILNDIGSISNAIKTFNKFEKCSGLKLNMNKTEIIPIGILRNKNILLPIDLKEIRIKHGPFKALGVWYSINNKETQDLNFNERLHTIKTLLNIWKSRKLSYKGRITIIRTLILPQVQFLFSMIEVTDKILAFLEKIFFEFLWENKPSKIKRNTIIAPVEHGGLGMIDVYAVHTTAKCSWIRRLYDNTNAKWKIIFLVMLNINMDILNKNLDKKMIENCRSEFHKQTLACWIQLTNIEPINYKQIANEYIIHNRLLKINKEVVTPSFFKTNDVNSIQNIRIYDMISQQNTLLNHTDFNNQNQTVLSILEYNALKSCIPKNWKKIILKNNMNNIVIETVKPAVTIFNIKKEIGTIKSKELYGHLILQKIKTPSSVETWIDTYPFLEQYNWKDIYIIPFKYVTEPYLQSFQYKVINRILNTNEKLHKWKIIASNKCHYCKSIDTLEHHLFYCSETKCIWDKLEIWIYNQFELKLNLTVCEVLFGIPFISNEYIEVINFIIILAKWYINSRKSKEKPLYLIELLNIIQTKIKLLTLANTMNDRQNKPWQDILENVL